MLSTREARSHADRALVSRALGGRLERLREERSGYQYSSLKSPSELLVSALGLPTKSGANVNENTAFNVAVVRACINLRANLLAMLPLKLYQRTPRGPMEASDHLLSKLLKRKPGPAHTSFNWRHSSSVCFDLGGNAYSRIFRDQNFEINEIAWTRPCDVEPMLMNNRHLSYRLKDGTMLADYEMAHVRNLSTNGYTGRSPLADLRDTVGLAMTAEDFSAGAFRNGNRMPGVFEGSDSTTTDKAREFKKFWEENYIGAANAGRTPVLIGGIKWKEAGFSNQDAELLMTRKFSVEEIARVYHLPLHLVNSTEKSTTWGSGIEQLNQGLVDYTLLPLCRNHEQEYDDKFLTEKEKDAGYYIKFGVDALLRGSFETRAKIYQIMRGIAAMDVNQIRTLEEWELYPDSYAGDPRQPLNNVAVHAADPQPAAAGGEGN